jgi:hypothetical protein
MCLIFHTYDASCFFHFLLGLLSFFLSLSISLPAPKSLATKTKTIIPEEKKDELDWDAYLLSKLDKHIATRLVHEKTTDPDWYLNCTM